MTTAPAEPMLSEVQARVHDAVLDQACRDLADGADAACAGRIDLLLGGVPRARAPAVLALRLLQGLSRGALPEARNIAYYLAGGFARAERSGAVAHILERLADWPRLPALLAPLGVDPGRPDPDGLIGRLAGAAAPTDDPAWHAMPAPPDGREPPVVVVSLANGLGNQMFQYAAALRRARRCSAALRLDLSVFSQEGVDTRPFALAPFALTATTASPDELLRTAGRQHEEDVVRFDRAIMVGGGDCRLQGCWTLPIYFRGVEDALRAEFRFRDPAIAARAAATVAPLRRAGPVVGLHVRRGDYLAPGYRNSYNAHPSGYYRAALARFPAGSSVIAFSDTPADRDWCAAEFAELGARLIVSRAPTDIDDFALLAACDHQILSVSSFSWWAAWLNPNPAKRIVAAHPALGLGPKLAHVQLAGRLPAEWTVLSWDDVVAFEAASDG